MNDIMLFGEGWTGEVRQVEDGKRQFRYIPHRDDPHLREVMFAIIGYMSSDGHSYLVGYAGFKPLIPDIEEAIMRYKPVPIE